MGLGLRCQTQKVSRFGNVGFLQTEVGARPAEDFLSSTDQKMHDKILRILAAIIGDPKSAMRPNGFWKPLRADLAGVWELRCIGPGRVHYRLFVLIDKIGNGTESSPCFVLLTGATKPNATLLPKGFYVELENLTTLYWHSIFER